MAISFRFNAQQSLNTESNFAKERSGGNFEKISQVKLFSKYEKSIAIAKSRNK